ncbi:hypothetical protein AURDEDRAFT_184589 [Auricularia subglabra TFB-10046 SS5]|nr:hypothetical protein AURDEDRAFT_184589 [Auricularia subglabra TFB-10046 SS5]
MAVAAASIFLPAELRRHIALRCDQETLARLCSVDRLWAAECVNVLYTSVEVNVRHTSEERNPVQSCVNTFAGSQDLAALVCTLTIYYPDNDWRAHKLLGNLYENLLPLLRNLRDLRIYEVAYDRASLVPLLMLLASDRAVFRLRALYVPRSFALIENHALLSAALRRQPELRIFGTHSFGGLSLEGHFVRLVSLRDVTPFFTFDRDPDGVETTLSLYLPTLATAALVGPVLDNLADARPRDWSSFASRRGNKLPVSGSLTPPSRKEVVALRLYVARLPDAELVQLLSNDFPDTRDVQFMFQNAASPQRLEPHAVAMAVSPMVHLRTLRLDLERFAHPPADGLGDALAIAQAVSDAGCLDLESVGLHDGTSCRRQPGSHSWESSGR